MEAQRQSRSRGRRLVAVGGAIVAGVAAGAGMMQMRRRRAEDAELWAEAQRTDLPPVPTAGAEPAPGAGPVSTPEETLEQAATPRSEPEIEVELESVRDCSALPAEMRPHDPSYGEVI